MANLPKLIYVKHDDSDYILAAESISELLDQGEKVTVGIYKLQELVVGSFEAVVIHHCGKSNEL